MPKFSNLMFNEGNKNHGFSDNAHLETIDDNPFLLKSWIRSLKMLKISDLQNLLKIRDQHDEVKKRLQ